MRLPDIEAGRSFMQFLAGRKEAKLVKRGKEEAERKGKEEAGKVLEQQAAELTAKMRLVEVFPGNKSEYEELTGREFDFVRLQCLNQYIRGTFVREADVNPYDSGPRIRTCGSIFEQAVQVGAEAVVNVTYVDVFHPGAFGYTVFQGSPVKERVMQEAAQPQ